MARARFAGSSTRSQRTAFEKEILAYSLNHPTHCPLRVAQLLVLQNIQVSAGGVRGVWSRQNLMRRHDRLLRLENTAREKEITLSDTQVKLL